MLDKRIEFPDHELKLWEVADILKTCLNGDEMEEFTEELLCWPSKGGEILEPCDYDMEDEGH